MTQRWVPPPVTDPIIDLAIKTIYENHYQLQQTALNTLVNNETIARGQANVTGSLLRLVTGLTAVTSVTVSLDSGTAGVAEIATGRISPHRPGSIDIFVNQTNGSASVTQRSVHWQVTGQQ